MSDVKEFKRRVLVSKEYKAGVEKYWFLVDNKVFNKFE